MKKTQDHAANGTTFSDTIMRTIKNREVTISYSITVTDETLRRVQHLLLESVTEEMIAAIKNKKEETENE